MAFVSDAAGGETALPTDSILRQSATPKDLQKVAAGMGEDEQKGAGLKIEEVIVTPTSGVVLPPVSPEPAWQTADYYRFGRTGTQSEPAIPQRKFEEWNDDRRTASIRIRGKGKNDSEERDFIPAYTKFFLQTVSESHQERSQIVETFGDFYVFLFGERPPIYNFSGILMNAKNANWVQDYMFFYENYLRGTKCVELGARAIITYAGRQVEGFILNTSNQTQSMTDGGVPMSFQVVVTSRKYLGFSEDFGFASNPETGTLVEDQKLRELIEGVAGAAGKGSSNPETDKAINATDSVLKKGDAARQASILSSTA